MLARPLPRRPRATLALALVSALASSLAAPARAQEVDLAAREWSGPWGGGARTAFVDVEPVRGEPRLAWERAYDELVAGPVTFGGNAYLVVREGRTLRLRALDLATGEERGAALVGDQRPFELHAAPGALALCGPGGTSTYVHRGTSLRKAKSVREAAGGGGVGGDYLFTASGHALDLARGKVVATWPSNGTPFVFRRADGSWLLATLFVSPHPSYDASFVRMALQEARVEGGALALKPKGSLWVAPLQQRDEAELSRARLLPIVRPYRVDWFASCLPRLRVRLDEPACAVLFGDEGQLGVAPLVSPGVRCGEVFYGFDEAGGLIAVRQDARFLRVLAPDQLPKGARACAPTAARGVVYLGNWAVESPGQRVLWSLAELPADVPAIPAGDRRLLYAEAQRLSCYVDGSSQEPALAGATGAGERPSRPDAGPGVVLADGRRVAGAVEPLATGGLRLRQEGGERELADGELALVVGAEEARLVGRRQPVLRAFEDALGAEHRERLEALFDAYLEAHLLDDCERLLDEAQLYGLGEAERTRLHAKLGGVTVSRAANAERQAARIARDERRAREASLASWLEAARWCAARGLPTVASALCAGAQALVPGEPAPEQLAAELVPAEFPWGDAPDRAQRWMRFARALVPADAGFVAADDPLRASVEGTVWAGRTLLLRSPNLVLHSRVDEPEIVGTCLRNGERAIAALESLLGEDGRSAASDAERLDVRLHATRRDYLAEEIAEDVRPMPWSVGVYVPSQQVSRFHLPEKGQALDPLGRGLFAVFAHELTHHWLDLAWRERYGIGPGPDPERPGFWIVEGIARFVEDQVLESDRRGFAFDDRTVSSLDVCAQLAGADELLPSALLVDATQLSFLGLGDELVLGVRRRNTLSAVLLSQRNLFYEQAAALVFFLANERGPEGRQALIAYLTEVYSGRGKPEGWTRLGFESADALDQAFHEFLRTLRG